MWRGGTEQNLRFGGSVTEAENDFRGTIPSSGHGTEQKFKFGGSAAERPSSVDTEREGLTEVWRKAILSFPVPYKTKMDPTLSRPVLTSQ